MIYYEKQTTPAYYGRTSIERLNTCAHDIRRICHALAQDGWDITIVCGERDEQAQTDAYNCGKSKAKWGESKHNVVDGVRDFSDAVDIAPYIKGFGIPWDNEPAFIILAGAFMATSQKLGIKVRWGGLFTGLKDLGHFELMTDGDGLVSEPSDIVEFTVVDE